MQIWYGSTPGNLSFFPSIRVIGKEKMTAIAMAYDPLGGRFVIAADGRCSSDTVPSVIQTDAAQKIFPAQNQHMNIAYSMTGFASTSDGAFDTAIEAKKQIDTLSGYRFINGYEYAARFCFNLKRAIGKALSSGRIESIPVSEELPPQEKGRMLRFFLFGYYVGLPFCRVTSFYHDKSVGHISVRP